MPFGFYIIMAAQFFSSLADNALLVAAIALLMQLYAPEWMTPMLKFFFTVSYVLFAAVVGAFADSMPKGRVMFITNTIKIIGCMMIFFHELWSVPGLDDYFTVLFGYAVVGLGAAAYSPAKYGILTEYLPHHKLVVANGWIEGLTVSSIILGTLLGGALVSERVSDRLLAVELPHFLAGIDTPVEIAIAFIAMLYLIAAIFNLYIPNTGVDHKMVNRNPVHLIREFAHCMKLLWTDKLGQISLATTTLFWGAGATLQFIVHPGAGRAMNWPRAEDRDNHYVMGMDTDLDEAARLAIRESVAFLQAHAGLSAADAYALTSLAVDFRIGEAVNHVKMVYGVIPKRLLLQ